MFHFPVFLMEQCGGTERDFPEESVLQGGLFQPDVHATFIVKSPSLRALIKDVNQISRHREQVYQPF